jgi:hypothetical protein
MNTSSKTKPLKHNNDKSKNVVKYEIQNQNQPTHLKLLAKFFWVFMP